MKLAPTLLTLALAATATAAAPPSALPPVRSDKLPALAPSRQLPPAAALTSTPADDKTAADVRTTLARVVNNAASVDKFPDFLADLAKTDRDRISGLSKEKFDDLNKAITQFRDAYRTRYHQEFTLQPEHLKEAAISQGKDANVVTVSLSDLEKNPAVNPAPSGVVPSPLNPTGDLGKSVPANTGLSVVSGPTITLLAEGKSPATTDQQSRWKISIPDEITGTQLKESITRHFQKLADQKTTWSDDPNATARAAATQLFQALNETNIASEK